MPDDADGTEHPASWHALVAAAEIEFDAHGFDGVRIEHVAARAGFNKSLVYRYFGGKAGLHSAVLEAISARGAPRSPPTPDSLAELLAVLAHLFAHDPRGARLLLRSGPREGEATATDADPELEKTLLKHLKTLQSSGKLEPTFDSEILSLVLLGVAAVPLLLPHRVRSVTGLTPGDPTFRERWEDTLVWVADAIGG
ncbi:MAG: TetR/AcrR family transcriptional regulator [Longimicrobiales bacterium]|nr:TetR/AcrR family transcriptional regulator [Longimicrobiales bacterium]